MEKTGKFAKYVIHKSDLKNALGRRDLFSNKYSSGRVLIIGGSSSYYGAPVLALNSAYQSLASLRAGAGYVKALVPQSILSTARSLSPNTVIEGLGKKTIVFNKKAKDEIEKASIVIIGMGLGSKSAATAKKIIEHALKKEKKLIVDADAIPAIKNIRIKKAGSLIITPHDGEFFRLTGKKLKLRDMESRIKESVKAANRYNAIIVLKGHSTIVTDGKRIKINNAKTAALATMGTGDVLSGIIGGYAAKGADLFSAAVAGVYFHSRIGDILYKKKGNHIIATDIIDALPNILKGYGDI